MKKLFYSAVVALALLGASARAAHIQSSGVRVGPAADEAAPDVPAAPKPRREEEKAAPAAADPKGAHHAEPKKESAAGRDAVGGEKNRAPEKSQGTPKTAAASSLSNSTASAVPPATGKPSATSDAPPKTGSDTTVPVGAAVKTASGAVGAPDSERGAQPSLPGGDANAKTAPAVPNASAISPNPSPSAASLANLYRIGVGDVLDIRLLSGQDPRQSTLYPVLAGGVLDYPLLRDPLTVSGMTTEELAAQLIAEFRHRGLYERPQVRVSVREYASHAVLVSGLVNDPGTKILRREAIPLYVVIAEAQPKPEAGRAVVISHSTGMVFNVDLNDAAGLNTLVQSGDVVTLTVRPPEFFYVGGEIASPGQKDFHAGLTLTQALLASGGVTRTAGDRVRVARQGADGRLVTAEYNLREIEGGAVPDPALQAGDRIEVPARRK